MLITATHNGLNEIELSPAASADTGRDPAANEGKTAQLEGTHPLNADFARAQGAEYVRIEPVTDTVPGGTAAATACSQGICLT